MIEKSAIEKHAGSMLSAEETRGVLSKLSADDLRLAYLDFVNNFLTVKFFASYYGLSIEQAEIIVTKGREVQESYAAAISALKNM